MRMTRGFEVGVYSLAGLLTAGSFILMYETYAYETKFAQVQELADQDEIGGTTKQEWQAVYDELNVQYSNPRDLTKYHLERYLENHE